MKRTQRATKTEITEVKNPKAEAPAPQPQIATVEEWQSPTPDDYVKRIATAWQKSIDSIVEVGRLLIEAKAKLPHGQFQTLFDEQKVPFSGRMAQQLMDIARNPVLSNPNHGSHLPPHWRTMYELTRLPEKELEKKLSDGAITPDTTRTMVMNMVKECGYARVPEALQVLTAFMRDWPDAASLAPHVSKEILTDSRFVALDFAKLAPWITELQQSCRHLIDATKRPGALVQPQAVVQQSRPKVRETTVQRQ